MKEYLTTDQSKELIDLGISPDCASMILWCATQDFQNYPIKDQKWNYELKPFRPAVMGFESFTCLDVFTIGDLMKLLPHMIYIEQAGLEDWCNLNIQIYKDSVEICYDTWTDMGEGVGGTCHIGTDTIYEKEFIDGLFKLVKWCIANDKLNKQ